MARAHPTVASLQELRVALSRMRLSNLTVGEDGRNRCPLSAFSARTGRNQPSNSKFIFGPSTWLRGLIRPEPGYGLAYIDWSQQEFGIAAALSKDPLMMEAYLSDLIVASIVKGLSKRDCRIEIIRSEYCLPAPL